LARNTQTLGSEYVCWDDPDVRSWYRSARMDELQTGITFD